MEYEDLIDPVHPEIPKEGSMPSYTVYARAGTFTGYQRDAVAWSITILHSEHTGAPRSFVQTILLPLEPGTHYVGAEPTDPHGTWDYETSAPGVRTAIAVGIRDALEEIAQIPREFIWVYRSELVHTDMIEFGSVDPVPGGEAAWVQAMDPAVREHLLELG